MSRANFRTLRITTQARNDVSKKWGIEKGEEKKQGKMEEMKKESVTHK